MSRRLDGGSRSAGAGFAGAGAGHEPRRYDCPFCSVVRGEETEHNRPADVVWRDTETVAFVSPRWWPANAGHVIVIPCAHVENLYAIDERVLGAVHATVKRVAIAMKSAYGCAGTSTRQHNEPAAGQDVWHFHMHVFPREPGDELYPRDNEYRWASASERAPYAARLRAALSGSDPGLTRDPRPFAPAPLRAATNTAAPRHSSLHSAPDKRLPPTRPTRPTGV